MRNKFTKHLIALFVGIFILISDSFSQGTSNVKIGAYYFDGWTGSNSYQLNNNLKNNYPERRPIWGWVTSTQETVNKQITLASSYGISFFNFCWYYDSKLNKNIGDDDKNHALSLFLKSPNKSKLDFSLFITNNQNYNINPDDWDSLTDYWITLFQDPAYVRINNKPFITFFSLESLIKSFGSTIKVKQALNSFRKKSQIVGLGGVSIAICLSPNLSRIKLAENCGFDILTNYNYHKEGFKSQLKQVRPIKEMQIAESKVWNKLSSLSKLSQIPTVTLNWDQRPTELGKINISSRFTGFSKSSITQQIKAAKNWIISNPTRTTKDKIINVYAWNEYSEGAWLTPSGILGNSLLEGIKSGLKQ